MSAQADRYRNIVKRIYHDRTIGYHPDMAKALGSVKAALFFQQLLWWDGNPSVISRDGWFWKTTPQMYEETGLSEAEQNSARKCLTNAGLIETKLDYTEFKTQDGETHKNWQKVFWYRVDDDRMADIMTDFYETGAVLERRKPGNRKTAEQKREKGRFKKVPLPIKSDKETDLIGTT